MLHWLKYRALGAMDALAIAYVKRRFLGETQNGDERLIYVTGPTEFLAAKRAMIEARIGRALA